MCAISNTDCIFLCTAVFLFFILISMFNIWIISMIFMMCISRKMTKVLQPQIRKSWDSMENANKIRKVWFLNLLWLVFHCRQYEHKIFHVLSGQLHVICKYTSFPVIQTCKKLGQEQFRASNEVNWLNNDVIETGDVNRWL